MTRRSKRAVEDRLDALETDATTTPSHVEVVWRDERTGELVDRDGTPTEPDPEAFVVVIEELLVMGRERAEREGREILGPATDAPPENDAVRVAREEP
jgi:hypothetical protein